MDMEFGDDPVEGQRACSVCYGYHTPKAPFMYLCPACHVDVHGNANYKERGFRPRKLNCGRCGLFTFIYRREKNYSLCDLCTWAFTLRWDINPALEDTIAGAFHAPSPSDHTSKRIVLGGITLCPDHAAHEPCENEPHNLVRFDVSSMEGKTAAQWCIGTDGLLASAYDIYSQNIGIALHGAVPSNNMDWYLTRQTVRQFLSNRGMVDVRSSWLETQYPWQTARLAMDAYLVSTPLLDEALPTPAPFTPHGNVYYGSELPAYIPTTLIAALQFLFMDSIVSVQAIIRNTVEGKLSNPNLIILDRNNAVTIGMPFCTIHDFCDEIPPVSGQIIKQWQKTMEYLAFPPLDVPMVPPNSVADVDMA